MKASVLIIEDEFEIAELIKLYLENEGFSVLYSETSEKGLEIVKNGKIDIIVLDINLPGMDGFEFLQALRKDYAIPVVIVSARQDDADMILGLGIGADDYVTKPFSPKVLAARVRANLRRYALSDDAERSGRNIFRLSGFTVDKDAYLVKKGNERIPLSPREFEVLIHLLENPGEPSTPEEIYSAVWGNNFGDLTTVAVHIQRLRKKLEKDPANPQLIETVHSLGYKIRKELIS
ncbi:MAG: response regulator transcription factor [Spirochaetia bacterium]|jgi:two-component system response regulator RegX3|nr:response regulator transcription factor [Spirochaetia bacterium]